MKQTPIKIRIVATLAIVAMILLIAVAIRALTIEPERITTTERIVVSNDSLVTLREDLAELRGKYQVMEATAAARLETIHNLTGPLGNISDTLLALQRGIEAGNWAQRVAIERDRADRADRFQALKESADRVEQLQQDVPVHFTELEENIVAILHRPPDTVRIPTPRRRSFFTRLLSRS